MQQVGRALDYTASLIMESISEEVPAFSAAHDVHKLQHCGFVGDVTALQLVSLTTQNSSIQQDFVAAGTRCHRFCAWSVSTPQQAVCDCWKHAGMGSQLLVYQLSTGHLALDHTVFSSGVHVHGIHAIQLPGACQMLAVHGERFVKVCIISKFGYQMPHALC